MGINFSDQEKCYSAVKSEENYVGDLATVFKASGYLHTT